MATPQPPSTFGRYVVILAGLALVLSGAIVVLRPEADNLGTIAAIFAFAGSVLAILKGQETHLSVNSRLDEWIESSNKVAFGKGETAGRDEERERHET